MKIEYPSEYTAPDIYTRYFIFAFNTTGFLNDSTIEERVSVLEFQVTELTEDVTDLEEGLTLVETEQIIQDDRILELELDSSG